MNISPLSHDEQIEKLNQEVKCRIAPSFNGIGVFALRDIKKGEDLFIWDFSMRKRVFYTVPLDRFHEIRKEVRTLILDRWAQPEGGALFQSPNDDANMMSFMNHANGPNSHHGIAIRDIPCGMEITEDYHDLGCTLSDIQKAHYNFL